MNTHSLNLVSASSQAVSIADDSALKPTGHFTIEGWIQNNGGTNQTIFQSRSRDSNEAGIRLFISSNGRLAGSSGNNTGTISFLNWQQREGSVTINNGIWWHVAFVWNGSELTLYLNGMLDFGFGSTNWTKAPAYATTNYVRVGCENQSGSNSGYFNGRINRLRLFNDVRTPQELIDNRFNILTPGVDNLVDEWNFDNTLISESGNHDGTGINSPTFNGDVPFPKYTNINPVQLRNTTLFSDSDIVSYFPLDEDSNDVVGSNDGTDTNISYVSGGFGKAADFNGSDSMINVGADNSLNFLSDFTICSWMYPRSAGEGNAGVIFKRSDISNQGYRILMGTSAFQHVLLAIPGNSNISSSSYSINYNTSNHFVVVTVSAGGVAKIYINGILRAESSVTVSTAIDEVGYIGGIGNGDGTFNGLLYDQSFFKRELTSEEIFELYTGLNVAPTTELIQKGMGYSILLRDSLTKQLEYSVSTQNALTKSLKYVVLATPDAITKGLTYSVVTIPSAIQKSMQYIILDTTAITKGLEYILTSGGILTKELKYVVLATPNAITKGLKYVIKQTPNAITKALRYSVVQTPNAITKSLEYAIRTTPEALTKSMHYSLAYARHAIQKPMGYAVVKGAAAIKKLMSYQITIGGYIDKYLKQNTQYSNDDKYTAQDTEYTDKEW